MPIFTNQVLLACSPAEVFEFLRVPANRLHLAPPEVSLELVEGPALLDLGSRTTWKTRRLGVSQSLVLEVTQCVPPGRLVEEQRQGPFRRWVQTLLCHPHDEGTLMEDVIDFEPPGGVLGLLMTAAKIEEMLAHAFAWRDRELRGRLQTDKS